MLIIDRAERAGVSDLLREVREDIATRRSSVWESTHIHIP